jgi:hypothetical protein
LLIKPLMDEYAALPKKRCKKSETRRSDPQAVKNSYAVPFLVEKKKIRNSKVVWKTLEAKAKQDHLLEKQGRWALPT